METVREFRDLKYRDKARSIPMHLVWAGHEPLEFTNLFPAWTERLDVANLNLKVRICFWMKVHCPIYHFV